MRLDVCGFGEKRNPSMKIQYAKLAVKSIETMDRPTKQRIKQAIEGLPQGDVKRLKGVTDSIGCALEVGESYFHILQRIRS